MFKKDGSDSDNEGFNLSKLNISKESIQNSPLKSKNKFKMTKENINLFLIDKSKLDYIQMDEALDISLKQVNSLLKFCQEKEPIIKMFIEHQIEFFQKNQQSLLSLLDLLKSQNNIIKERLDFLKITKNQYFREVINLEEDEDKCDKKISELNNELMKLEININELETSRKKYLDQFNEVIYENTRLLLNSNFLLMWQVQEMFMGLILNKEKISNHDIHSSFESYNTVKNILDNSKGINEFFNHDVLQFIQEIERSLVPLNNESSNILVVNVFQYYIEFSKAICNLNAQRNDYAKVKISLEKFIKDEKKLEMEIRRKKLSEEIFSEFFYLEIQHSEYSKMIRVIEDYVKKTLIAEFEEIINNFNKFSEKKGDIILTEEEKKLIYKEKI